MATIDPRRISDAKDAWVSALYAKTVGSTADDSVLPMVIDSSGYLLVNMTVGTLTLNTTATTITNAVGNPANVSLTNTKVTVESSGLNVTLTSTKVTIESSGLNVTLTSTAVTASLSTTKVTVDNTITSSLSSTIVTAHLSPSASLATVSLSSTIVTAHLSPSASLATVSLASTRVTVTLISGQTAVDGNTGAVAATTLRVVEANESGKTLTGATGTISATWTSIYTPSNKAKIYAFSFTTTSSSEVTVLICDGAFANAKEKWRVTLMAPSGANSGANLAVPPTAYLFATRSTSAVTISLSTAVLVHYSLSFYDEA